MPFTPAQLHQLLTSARRRNTELDVMGALLYGNEQFLQVLGGEEDVVQQVYAHIRQDPRHRNILTFANNPVAARAFQEWAMGFQALAVPQFEGIVGYLGPPEAPVSLTGFYQDRCLFDLLRTFVLP